MKHIYGLWLSISGSAFDCDIFCYLRSFSCCQASFLSCVCTISTETWFSVLFYKKFGMFSIMSMSLKNYFHYYEMFVLFAICLPMVLLLSWYTRQFCITQIWQIHTSTKKQQKNRKHCLNIDKIYVDDFVSQNTNKGVSQHFTRLWKYLYILNELFTFISRSHFTPNVKEKCKSTKL